MNRLYVNETGRVLLDENNNILQLNSDRQAIDRVFLIDTDTEINYSTEGVTNKLVAPAGSLVICFYENEFPNKVIVVNSDEWKENIKTYRDIEQKLKEEWAAKKCCDCENCDACKG